MNDEIDTIQLPKKKLEEPLTSKNIQRAFCPFCFKFISKFNVHLEIQHYNEAKVKAFLNLKKSTKRRRNLIATIRHEGYGLYYAMKNKILPVSRKQGKGKQDNSKKRQCEYCHGHYMLKSLWKHKRICLRNPNNL